MFSIFKRIIAKSIFVTIFPWKTQIVIDKLEIIKNYELLTQQY